MFIYLYIHIYIYTCSIPSCLAQPKGRGNQKRAIWKHASGKPESLLKGAAKPTIDWPANHLGRNDREMAMSESFRTHIGSGRP